MPAKLGGHLIPACEKKTARPYIHTYEYTCRHGLGTQGMCTSKSRPKVASCQVPTMTSGFCHLTACRRPNVLLGHGQMALLVPLLHPLIAVMQKDASVLNMACPLAHAHCKHVFVCFNSAVLHIPQITARPPRPPHATQHRLVLVSHAAVGTDSARSSWF